STRTVAAETGISKSTVQRWLQTFSIQPHRQENFKISTDPFFVEKVRDVVGLYLNPPDNAVVLCVDEKSQVQALDRTQPLLPLGLGYVEGVTHDYIRHGTTTLFAALDVATRELIAQCKPRHQHQEFLSFLRQIEKSFLDELDVHLIEDNYCTHKHAKARAWLAQRKLSHIHYASTYASWITQVERWFGIVAEHAIRRGSFRSVKEALDNRSPVEAVPCTNWELRALTGVAEGLSRVSLKSWSQK
ncbi:MAG: IS630 family transposase, partial [Cyanobacteriota bacterium]